MAKNIRNYARLVTPVGTLRWAKIMEPQPNKFKENALQYSTDIMFDVDSPEVAQLRERFETEARAYLDEEMEGKTPVQRKKIAEATYADCFHDDLNPDTAEPTGLVRLTARQDAEWKSRDGRSGTLTVGVFSADGSVIPKDRKVGNGSEARLAIEYRPYFMPATGKFGVSIRLKAVKINKLVEFAGGGSGFDAFSEFADDDAEVIDTSTTEVSPVSDDVDTEVNGDF